MSLAEIQATAFAKWLLKQDRFTALMHLWECLKNGDRENLAWQLWEAVHGTKSFRAEQINEALESMLDALRGDAACDER